MDELTRLLNRVADAVDAESRSITAGELLPLVYQKLRQVAAEKITREPAAQTLQATALVHEAWLRVGGDAQSWQSRWHFFGAAAEAMRRILVDRARSKQAKRHGGGLERVAVDEMEIAAPVKENELLDVHEALDAFAAHYPQKAELVKLRYFTGLTLPEAAEVLGISVPTAARHWAFSRVWLFREINRRKGRN
jgi:RNA polymerase sigma factor (TIGR02999 family)